MTDELRYLLHDTEEHIVSLFRAINPNANYESDYADHRVENRMADNDSIVKRIRKALKGDA
jgi:hypothetical protein